MARIAGLQGRRGTGWGFDDLPPVLRFRAQRIFSRLCARWQHHLPTWRLALLVARARDLALRPRDSSWGRAMLAKRSAKALHAKLRREDRRWPGGRGLVEHMTHLRVQKQRAVKRARQPGFPRSGFTNLDGI